MKQQKLKHIIFLEVTTQHLQYECTTFNLYIFPLCIDAKYPL